MSVIVPSFDVTGGYRVELTGGLSGGSRLALPPEVGKSSSNMFVSTTVPGGNWLLPTPIGRTTVVFERLHSTRLVTLSEEPGRLCFFQQQTTRTTSSIKSTHAQTHPTIIHMLGPEWPASEEVNWYCDSLVPDYIAIRYTELFERLGH